MRLKIGLIAILAVGCVAATLLLKSRPHFLDVVWKIEYRANDAAPYILDVVPQGSIYAIENTRGRLVLRAYGTDGKALWSKPLSVSPPLNFDAIVASFPGRAPICRAINASKTDIRILKVIVDADYDVTLQTVRTSPLGLEGIIPVAADAGHVYVVGDDYNDNVLYPTMVAISNNGRSIWRTRTDSIYCGVTDTQGNLVVAGSVDAGVGPYVAKYSKDGRKLWYWETSEIDGGGAIWVGTDRTNAIYSIGSQHEGNYTESGDDTSMRGRDQCLFKHSPAGKLLSKTVLAHGAWLDIVDATINVDGGVIAVGNRHKTTLSGYPEEIENAELINCDANGRIVWSRTLKLPHGYLANSIRLDAKGGIYIIGSGGATNTVKRLSYKVAVHDN